MSLATVGSLVDAIQQHRLLEPGQLEQLPAMQVGVTDPRALAKLLMERNWLTPFQLNQVLSGRVQDLLLGSYVLLQRLGEGGTGQVFKARHQRMRRIVALKVIRRELLSEEEVLARFYREIRVASQVAHPHVVHAYDAGPVGNTHFLAMEYVNGIDLGQLVKQSGALPVEQAGDYICQAAVGLQHIAEQGLIHRDIKPSNLLVTPDPRPHAKLPSGSRPADGEGDGQPIDPTAYPWGLIKILDLGLARFEKPLHGELTGTYTPVGGVMMGTPDYMAPEQALDFHDTDIRSDIYSLGCTFYYLLTGQPPFPGGTLAQKLLHHQQSPPPLLAESHSDVSPRIQAVLTRMLAKKPDDRYQTPGELAADLTAALRGEPSPAVDISESAIGQAPLPADGIYSHSGVLMSAASQPAETLLPLAEESEPTPAEAPVSAIPAVPVTAISTEVAPVARMVPGPVDSPVPRSAIISDPPFWLRWAREHIVWVAALGVLLVFGLALIPFVFTSSKEVGKDSGKLSDKSITAPTMPEGTADNIPATERFEWQPKELVAVLGEHRLRHWGSVTAIAYASKGKEIVSIGSDQMIRVWDSEKGNERAAYAVMKSWVPPISVGLGGKQAVTSSVDNTFRLWDTTTGKELMAFKGHQNRVIAIAQSLDGKTIASAGTDGTIRAWDAASGAERANTKREQAFGLTIPLSFLSDGKTVVTTGAPAAIRLWDTTTGKDRILPTGHKGFILALLSSNDGQTIASVGQDRTVRVMDVATGKERTAVPVASSPAAISSDGQLLAIASNDGSIKLWNVSREAREQATIKGPPGAISGVAFSPDKRTLASASADGAIRVWDVAALQESIPLQGHAGAIRHVAFSPDGKTIATSNTDRTIRIGDATTGREKVVIRPIAEPNTDPQPITVQFAPAGPPTLITVHPHGRLRSWDPATGKEQRAAVLVPGATNLQAAVCSPDGKSIAAAIQDATMKIIDVASGRETANLAGHRGRISTLVFTPDSQRVLSAGSDGTVRLWDAATGKQLSGFPAIGVISLSVCHHGKFAAWSSTSDHAVHLWDLENSKELALLPGHTNRVTGLVFSPAAAVLISTGMDGRVVVWDVETKRSLQDWHLPGPVITVAVAPDGRHIATGNSNGTAYVIRLNPPAPKAPAP